jgi:hypothetical protein
MIGDDKSFVRSIVSPASPVSWTALSPPSRHLRTAFATHNSRTVFLIGAVFAASVLIGQS